MTLEVGIIGLGDMGQLYTRKFAESGLVDTVNVCDIPEKYPSLVEKYSAVSNVRVWPDGFDVARRSDFLLYSVETEKLDKVVAMFGPSTKVGAIVGGQTSVKHPEIKAFQQHLPKDVHIVTCHSLHGPNIDTVGQPLVIINYRSTEAAYQLAKSILSCLKSNIVELSFDQHDIITADTQAVTHLAFLSMGSAWSSTGVFPWLNDTYTGGIENAKVLTTLRIYASKWHVYAGLALLNPSAKPQVSQYAKSVSELFKLMIQENETELRNRIQTAASFVFEDKDRQPILLCDKWLDEFSLSPVIPNKGIRKNSHLSLLAIVDSWYQLKIHPYQHMICQTPPFRMWLGITEFLFRTPELLETTIQTALYDKTIRADDLEFVNAAQAWSQTILLGSMDGYREKFEKTSKFFASRADEAKKLSTQMLSK